MVAHPPEWPEKANPDLMNIPDVALRLSVSEGFVRKAIDEGRLKHHRLGKGQGCIRVSEEQLAEFLRTTERGGVQKPEPKRELKSFQFLPPPS